MSDGPVTRIDHPGDRRARAGGAQQHRRLRRGQLMDNMPPAWADLLEGLALLAKHQTNGISPLHCEFGRA